MLYQKQSKLAAFSPLMLRLGSFICQLGIIVPGFLRAICIRGHTRSVSNYGARIFLHFFCIRLHNYPTVDLEPMFLPGAYNERVAI